MLIFYIQNFFFCFFISAENQASFGFSPVSVLEELELCITYAHRDNKDKAITMIREFCEKQEQLAVIGGQDDNLYSELIKQLDSTKVYVKNTKDIKMIREYCEK